MVILACFIHVIYNGKWCVYTKSCVLDVSSIIYKSIRPKKRILTIKQPIELQRTSFVRVLGGNWHSKKWVRFLQWVITLKLDERCLQRGIMNRVPKCHLISSLTLLVTQLSLCHPKRSSKRLSKLCFLFQLMDLETKRKEVRSFWNCRRSKHWSDSGKI